MDSPRHWDRRDVIKAGGAAVGGIAMSQDVTGALAATANKNCLLVADTRIAASRDFAAQVVHSSERVAWIEGDITKLRKEELDTRWRDEMIAFACLTEYGPFFSLEQQTKKRRKQKTNKRRHRRD